MSKLKILYSKESSRNLAFLQDKLNEYSAKMLKEMRDNGMREQIIHLQFTTDEYRKKLIEAIANFYINEIPDVYEDESNEQ